MTESETIAATADISADTPEKINMKTLRRLVSYARPHLFLMMIAIVSASLAALIMISGATKVTDIVDLIKEGITDKPDMSAIKTASAEIIIMFVLYMLFSSIQGIIMSVINQRLICDMRGELEAKRKKMSFGSVSSLNTGEVLSVITNDVSRLSTAFSAIAIEFVPAVVLFAGTVIVMFSKNVILTVSVMISAAAGFLLVGVIMSRSQRYYVKQQEVIGSINGDIEEVFSGMTVVKSFCGEEYEQEKLDRLNEKMRKVNFKAFCYQALMMPIMMLVNNLGYIAVCVVGAILITKGSITFGLITSFMMYLSYFQEPMFKIGSSMQQLQIAAAASERIFSFLDSEEMETDTAAISIPDNVRGDVCFRNVWFGYEPEKRMIIKDFSLEVRSGQKVAIVGHTGAGKTTLINFLLRFYDINSGTITIDGVSIYDIPREKLRDMFAVVPQDSWVFNGTIRENIALSINNASDEQLDKVCKAVGLDYFISMLPDGYDTVIDEKTGLSQGQKQQLSIARAMLADRSMIILDEATSSVDVLLEKRIQESMDKLTINKTAFIIAHRLSTIENADVIIVMKDGNAAECGTHTELLKKGGVYAEFYRSRIDNEA